MSTTSPSATSYDEMPYTSKAFPQTHPTRLASLAKLFRMSPAPIEKCRVLELGCAAGGNLIPMAHALPGAKFVGVDLSQRQIQEGRNMVAALGLENLDLRHASIMDVDESYGTFDYVICHGVYSWVPEPVREKILAICRQHLAPQGVGYVSYNTYPGWRMRGMIRDMMCYHSRGFREATTRVQQARALLDFLVQSVEGEKDPYALYLKHELEVIKACSDSYVYHEHLEDVNEPCYFYQFAERLDHHRLCYLAEADFSTMASSNFKPETQSTLVKIAPDIIKMEQYMDFLRHRMFRQTLLCHTEVRLDRTIVPERVFDMHVASPLRPQDVAFDPREPGGQKFVAQNGTTVDVPQPLVKAALLILFREWPRPVAFNDIIRGARAMLGSTQDADPPGFAAHQQEFGSSLLLLYRSRLCELYAHPLQMQATASAQPESTRFARLLAEQGYYVCNARHEGCMLNAFERQMVRHLDGQHDRAAMIDRLMQLVRDKVLAVELEGKPIADDKVLREAISTAYDRTLPNLALRGLFVK